MSEYDLKSIPGVLLDGDEPIFNEPWEASAFALVIGLYEKGAFGWSEWAEVLSRTIHNDNANRPYYELWLVALETILAQKQLLSDREVSKRKEEWQAVLAATPHGQPIQLQN